MRESVVRRLVKMVGDVHIYGCVCPFRPIFKEFHYCPGCGRHLIDSADEAYPGTQIYSEGEEAS